MGSTCYSWGPLNPGFLAQLHSLWMVLFLASAVNLSHLLHFARTHMGSRFSPTQCHPWCVKCERVWLVRFMQGLQCSTLKAAASSLSSSDFPLMLSQPVSGWKCILVTFLFWWVLAPKPPAEAGRRHCFPLVWILIKSHLSSSKFKEKSDSVGVVPVHVSPAVSNLCVGHTRRRCAVIFRSSIAWFPACCLPRQHSLVLGDQSSSRAPGHEVSVQCSICPSQMQYCWFTCRAWRGFIENIWVRFAHDETKQSFSI